MANNVTKGHAIFKGPVMETIFESEMGVNLLAIFPTAAEAEKVRAALFNTNQHKVFKVEIP